MSVRRFFYLPFFVFLIFIISFPFFVKAAGIGVPVQHVLSLPDQSGEMQSFDRLKGERGLVLVFVRSVDWCPHCQAQLIDLAEESGKIIEQGYNIAALSYDSVDALSAFAQKYDFPFALLSDENSEAISAFGILNDEIPAGSSYYGIPHPSIFVISADGIVQEKIAEEGYKQRPPVNDILSVIRRLGEF